MQTESSFYFLHAPLPYNFMHLSFLFKNDPHHIIIHLLIWIYIFVVSANEWPSYVHIILLCLPILIAPKDFLFFFLFYFYFYTKGWAFHVFMKIGVVCICINAHKQNVFIFDIQKGGWPVKCVILWSQNMNSLMFYFFILYSL